MAHVGAVVLVVPEARGRVALVHTGAREAGALVVRAPYAARIVRVVRDRLRFARQVRAGVDEVERADLAGDRQRGIDELILGGARGEDRHLERLQPLSRRGAVGVHSATGFGTVWMLVEHTLAFDLLVGDGQQGIPVIGDLPLEAGADAAVFGFVDVVAGNVGIVDHEGVGRNDTARAARKAQVGALPREGAVDVVDVTATVVHVTHDTHGQLVVDERDVDHALDVVAVVAVRRIRVTDLDVAGQLIESWLVGDVTQHARLGAGAEQRALRPGQHFDALEVGCVDVEVATRNLRGLLVEVHRDVRPGAVGARSLGAERSNAEAAYVDVALARSEGGRRDTGQELHELLDRRDVQLRERLAGEGLDRQRDVLQAFRAALRGDDHFLEPPPDAACAQTT